MMWKTNFEGKWYNLIQKLFLKNCIKNGQSGVIILDYIVLLLIKPGSFIIIIKNY